MSILHSLIEENYSHPNFGSLLHHRDSQNPSILHYSVQLNDLEALAWEPIHCDRQKDTGRIGIWPIDWNRFQSAKWVKHLEKGQIKKGLHISVEQFHEHWQYELFRFNCEHWARLVTTGDCRCCQIQEVKKLQQIPIIGVVAIGAAGVVTGAWEHNRGPDGPDSSHRHDATCGDAPLSPIPSRPHSTPKSHRVNVYRVNAPALTCSP